MKLSQFKFNLPEELIAQYPSKFRDECRLLVLNRKTGEIEHKIFKDLKDYFSDKDFMIFNDTKVFPARLYGNKEKTGARIEVFLLRELNHDQRLWDILVDPARKIRIGNKLYFGEDGNELVAEVIDNTTSRGRTLRFLIDGDYDQFKKTLYSLGETPLPMHIIKRPTEPEDAERYQTIYAKNEGAVAAPTAGLHFSRELFKRLELVGVEFGFLRQLPQRRCRRPHKAQDGLGTDVHLGRTCRHRQPQESRKPSYLRSRNNRTSRIGIIDYHKRIAETIRRLDKQVPFPAIRMHGSKLHDFEPAPAKVNIDDVGGNIRRLRKPDECLRGGSKGKVPVCNLRRRNADYLKSNSPTGIRYETQIIYSIVQTQNFASQQKQKTYKTIVMTKMTSKYVGGLRTENTHLQSGNRIITDAPLDNHGKGEAFSPTDLLATALCDCIFTITGITAQTYNFSIDGATAQIEKIMNESPRRVAEVKIDFDYSMCNLNEKQQTIVKRIPDTCPVSRSLSPEVKQTITFKF